MYAGVVLACVVLDDDEEEIETPEKLKSREIANGAYRANSIALSNAFRGSVLSLPPPYQEGNQCAQVQARSRRQEGANGSKVGVANSRAEMSHGRWYSD